MTKKVGIVNGYFFPCSSKPNCISSMTENTKDSHYIEPLTFSAEDESLMNKIVSYMSHWPRTKLVEQSDFYLHYEVKSAIFGFTDDLEIYYDIKN
ncbi:MAG: DUF1499 domain-containing protein, partial [Bdellovibrionales bacterium]|nr:DUF1499 domain-containing protein [Bdellovibrionales bacterium]